MLIIFISICKNANSNHISNQTIITMKYIMSLPILLLGTNAVHDNDEAFRVLRGHGGGNGEGSGMRRSGRGGMMGGRGGGGRNHTMGNRTEMLINACADNGIVCEEVDQTSL